MFKNAWTHKYVQRRIPKIDSYRYAVQKPNECLENFMYRFNELALGARKDLSKPNVWMEHYWDWCDRLNDPKLSEKFSHLNLASKEILTNYVQMHESRTLPPSQH